MEHRCIQKTMEAENGIEKENMKAENPKKPSKNEQGPLEVMIEKKIEENIPVDVDVRRRGPVLWVTAGEGGASSPLLQRRRGAGGLQPSGPPPAAAAAVRAMLH
jgi:hypothetical protein